ncbi:hypothetical protein OIU79_028383, partial [Salix purpurea]
MTFTTTCDHITVLCEPSKENQKGFLFTDKNYRYIWPRVSTRLPPVFFSSLRIPSSPHHSIVSSLASVFNFGH